MVQRAKLTRTTMRGWRKVVNSAKHADPARRQARNGLRWIQTDARFALVLRGTW